MTEKSTENVLTADQEKEATYSIFYFNRDKTIYAVNSSYVTKKGGKEMCAWPNHKNIDACYKAIEKNRLAQGKWPLYEGKEISSNLSFEKSKSKSRKLSKLLAAGNLTTEDIKNYKKNDPSGSLGMETTDIDKGGRGRRLKKQTQPFVSSSKQPSGNKLKKLPDPPLSDDYEDDLKNNQDGDMEIAHSAADPDSMAKQRTPPSTDHGDRVHPVNVETDEPFESPDPVSPRGHQTSSDNYVKSLRIFQKATLMGVSKLEQKSEIIEEKLDRLIQLYSSSSLPSGAQENSTFYNKNTASDDKVLVPTLSSINEFWDLEEKLNKDQNALIKMRQALILHLFKCGVKGSNPKDKLQSSINFSVMPRLLNEVLVASFNIDGRGDKMGLKGTKFLSVLIDALMDGRVRRDLFGDTPSTPQYNAVTIQEGIGYFLRKQGSLICSRWKSLVESKESNRVVASASPMKNKYQVDLKDILSVVQTLPANFSDEDLFSAWRCRVLSTRTSEGMRKGRPSPRKGLAFKEKLAEIQAAGKTREKPVLSQQSQSLSPSCPSRPPVVARRLSTSPTDPTFSQTESSLDGKQKKKRARLLVIDSASENSLSPAGSSNGSFMGDKGAPAARPSKRKAASAAASKVTSIIEDSSSSEHSETEAVLFADKKIMLINKALEDDSSST